MKTENKKVASQEQVKAWAGILVNSSDTAERRQAANGIYKAFYRNLVQFFYMRASGMSGEVRKHEDLAMSTLEKVFTKIHLYKSSEGQLSTWVYRIATNILVDDKRKSVRKDVISTEAFADSQKDVSYGKDVAEGRGLNFELRSSDQDPFAKVVLKQRASLVRKAIDSLVNADERLVMKLRFFEELSYEEIVERTSMPMGTVKAKIFRAKENLYNSLAPQVA